MSMPDRTHPTAAEARPGTGTTPTAQLSPTRRTRCGRRVPALVLAVTGLHVALLAMCTVLFPPFTGPDERSHMDMAYAYSKGHGLYPPGGRALSQGITVAFRSLAPSTAAFSDRPMAPRGQRPSLDAAGGDAAPPAPFPNQMVQHPPLYYLLGAGVLRLPGVDRMPFDRQLALLRWLSVLLIAPLPLLAWAIARRLAGADRQSPVALIAAVLPVTMPGLSRIGAMVNNDNLLILLAAVLLLLLARVVTGDLSARTGALVGLVLGLALLTKGTALVLPVPVAAAYLASWLRQRRFPVSSLGLAAGLSAALGGWWWIRNLIEYGAVQPSGFGRSWELRLIGGPRPGGNWLGLVPHFVLRFQSGYWGGLWLPHWLTALWLGTVVVGGLLGIALGIGGRWGRAAAIPFLLPALALTGLIFYGAGREYVYNLRLPGVQGRYVYPALTGLAVLFALGAARLAGRLARLLPLLLLAAGLLTQAWAGWLLLQKWWAPKSTVGDQTAMIRGALAGILRWSPWPAAPTVALFACVAVLSLVALCAAALAVRQPRTGPPGETLLSAGPTQSGDVLTRAAAGGSSARRRPSTAPGGPAAP